MMRVSFRFVFVAALLPLLAACQPPQQPPVLFSTKSPVELRAMESRAFEMSDRQKALRVIIATLQDLGYNIEKVEPAAGTVTAVKLSVLRVTASINLRGDTQVVVRANAEIKALATAQQAHQVDDPEFYQKFFFEPLSKSLFLTALQVEDPPDEATPQKAESPPAAQ